MKKISKNNLRVIDFFCGAGGFSEGFRQQGFKIVRGIDFWKPAIETHNLNHNLNDEIKNILDFWGNDSGDVIEIEKLEDVEFLIGSPSCVSFSMSNRSGKADKTFGIKLIKIYLRVVAVKKNKNNSVLKAWYMENVPKSQAFIQEKYTFEDLNLAVWAEQNSFKKTDVALEFDGKVLNAGDYGAPQGRKRFIAGEWVETGEFLIPKQTHIKHKAVNEIRTKMPKITESEKTKKKYVDPNYPTIELNIQKLTDHFYDTGAYKASWERAEFLKTNHPYMGMMSFPENENKTSRTIMATRSSSTRESLLYKATEYNRKGNGEYRLPTIREIACLMGFPYVYQFIGSELTKWKQIGNAVCPPQAAALAKTLRIKMGLKIIPDHEVDFSKLKENFNKIDNLNSFKENTFDSPSKKKKDANFRRHSIKLANMTIDLTNYHPYEKNLANTWYVSAFFGTGKGYTVKVFSLSEKPKLEKTLKNSFKNLEEYKKKILELSVDFSNWQEIYEKDLNLTNKKNPILLLKQLKKIIVNYDCHRDYVKESDIIRKDVPLAHVMAAYGLLSFINR